MMNGFVAAVANHLWQSTLFAGAMWGLARTLRRNSASVRYGVWMAASVKFLVPFALLVTLGSHFAWKPVEKIVTAPATAVMEKIGQPFAWGSVGAEKPVAETHVPDGEGHGAPLRREVGRFDKLRAGYGAPVLPPAARVALGRRAFEHLPEILLAVWFCGVVAGVGSWGRWMLRMRELRRGAMVVAMGLPVRVMTSAGQMEPCVFGLWRPVLCRSAWCGKAGVGAYAETREGRWTRRLLRRCPASMPGTSIHLRVRRAMQ